MLFSTRLSSGSSSPLASYYALTPLAISGMMLMAAATDLLVIFLALEILSLAVYVLTGIRRSSAAARKPRSAFLLGVFERVLLRRRLCLCVIGLDSTRRAWRRPLAGGRATIDDVPAGGSRPPRRRLCIQDLAVPFHMWTPDAYEGAPTIVTAFMSTGVSGGVCRLCPRVPVAARTVAGSVDSHSGGHCRRDDDSRHCRWRRAEQHQADAGLFEHRARRLSAPRLDFDDEHGQGRGALHPLAYAVSNLGALGIVALLGTAQHEHDELRDFAGLSKSRPGLAALMTVFSVAGRLLRPWRASSASAYIFSAAVERGHYWLAIIGVLTSVVSVFYLRIVVMMYMTDGIDIVRPRVPLPAAAGLALATLAVIYLGVLPARINALALDSISTIF